MPCYIVFSKVAEPQHNITHFYQRLQLEFRWLEQYWWLHDNPKSTCYSTIMWKSFLGGSLTLDALEKKLNYLYLRGRDVDYLTAEAYWEPYLFWEKIALVSTGGNQRQCESKIWKIEAHFDSLLQVQSKRRNRKPEIKALKYKLYIC